MSGDVALTSDIWTSAATNGYLTITVHFRNSEWELHTRVISTAEMPECHTGANIAERLRSTVEEWGITHVTALVHDNAANAVNAAELTEWPHFGCVAHTLQLAIKSGLDLPVISRLTAASRKLVGHFKHSILAMTALKGKQAQLGIKEHHLLQDVATRWNSTYFMMERLCEQRVAIYAVLHDASVTSRDDYRHLDLKDDKWELLTQMVAILKPLQVATTVFSLEQNVSCSIVYPVINSLLKNHLKIEQSELNQIKNFKRTISTQLIERFKPDEPDTAKCLPVLCSALDPRHSKLNFLNEEQRDIAHDAVICQAELLTCDIEIAEPPTKKKNSAKDFLLGSTKEREAMSSKDELEYFSKEPVLDRNSDPLEWWRKNEEWFPTLSKLAKKLFCIPATYVPSEQVFSIAGNIFTKKRASLKPENVDMLIVLNKNLPSSC